MGHIYTVTKPDMVSDPSYHPDGTKLIFTELTGSTYKISTITKLGGEYTVLLSGANPYADPYYSADGAFIVFAEMTGAVTGPKPYGEWSLLYILANGDGLSTIINDGNVNIHPAWVTPTQIAFQYWIYGVNTAYQIATIDIAGQGRKNFGEGEYPRVVQI